MHNDFIKTVGSKKDWYQLAAKWIIAGLGNAICIGNRMDLRAIKE